MGTSHTTHDESDTAPDLMDVSLTALKWLIAIETGHIKAGAKEHRGRQDGFRRGFPEDVAFNQILKSIVQSQSHATDLLLNFHMTLN